MIAEQTAGTESQLVTTIQETIRNTGNDRTRLLDIIQAAQLAIAVGLSMPVVEVENIFSFYAF